MERFCAAKLTVGISGESTELKVECPEKKRAEATRGPGYISRTTGAPASLMTFSLLASVEES